MQRAPGQKGGAPSRPHDGRIRTSPQTVESANASSPPPRKPPSLADLSLQLGYYRKLFLILGGLVFLDYREGDQQFPYKFSDAEIRVALWGGTEIVFIGQRSWAEAPRGRLRLPIGRLSCINVVIGCCEQNNAADRVFFANHAVIRDMKAILNPRALDHPYQGHQHGSRRLRIELYKNIAMKERSDKRYPSVLTRVLCSCPGNYAGNKPFSGVIWV